MGISLYGIGKRRHGVWFALYILATPAIVTLAGGTVDYSRMHLVKSRLITAVDSAALAASGLQGEPEKQKEIAERYVKALFPKRYMGTTPLKVTVTTSDEGAETQTIEVHAQTKFSMNFVSMGGLIEQFKDIPISWTSRAAWGLSTAEIVLILDHSASMSTSDGCSTGAPCTRLQAVKEVATNFINDVFTGEDTSDDSGGDSGRGIAVSLVPFSSFVGFTQAQRTLFMRMGRSHADALLIQRHSDNIRTPTAHPHLVCLANRVRPGAQKITRSDSYRYDFATLLDINDRLPDPSEPSSWFYQPHFYMSYAYGSFSCDKRVSSNPHGYVDGAISPGNLPSDALAAQSSYVVPLTYDKDHLLASIAHLQPTGATSMLDGMKWGFRALSPDWRGIWLEPRTLAPIQDKPKESIAWTARQVRSDDSLRQVRKYIILLTDGLSNLPSQSSYGFHPQRRCSRFDDMIGPSSRSYTEDFYDAYYGVTGFRSLCLPAARHHTPAAYHVLRGSTRTDGRSQIYSTGDATNHHMVGAMYQEVRERMVRELCTQMHRLGVEIYSVGFLLTDAEVRSSALAECVKEENRFIAEDKEKLQEVFDRIVQIIARSQRLIPPPSP